MIIINSFHVSIVVAIRRVTTVAELECLGQLIRETVILKDYSEIIAAWGAQYNRFFPNTTGEPRDVDPVTQSLLCRAESAARWEKREQEESRAASDWAWTRMMIDY